MTWEARAAEIWAELGLAELKPEAPWHGYDLGEWTDEMEAMAVRATEGEDAVFKLYWEYGSRIHHDQTLDFDIDEALEAAGLPTAHAVAFDSAEFDLDIQTRHDAGIALAGEDIGTPIIAFNDRKGVKQAYFGPVITQVPNTEDSLAMWDALVAMMNIDGFWELKRTRTEGPTFGNRP